MIIVKLSASGIHEVALESRTARDEDEDLVLWRLIRHEVDRLGERLSREAPAWLREHGLSSEPVIGTR